MGKFSNVLFTSDFDHTITGPDNRVPPANLEAIDRFISEGGRFCLNSGRSVPLLRRRAEEIPINAPCLCYNGAACYDYAARELIYANTLPELAGELLELIRESGRNVCIELQTIDRHYELGTQFSSRLKFLEQEGFVPTFTQELPEKPWMKLLVCGADGESVAEEIDTIEQEKLRDFLDLQRKIEEFCDGRCFVTRSMPRLIEISHPDCNKGRAARWLAERLGREILVCAGDAPNDEEMLRQADFAFCPADADETVLALPGIRRTRESALGCIADAVEQLEALSG